MITLDLGSGINPYVGDGDIVHMDKFPFKGVNIVRDVLRGIPTHHDFFDKVVAHNFLEHFAGEDFVFVMNEIWRVLKPGGVLEVCGPYWSGKFAFIDPDHKRCFHENSFDFWIVRDGNSVRSGVVGWFEMVKFWYDRDDLGDKVGLWFVFRKLSNEVKI